MAGAGLPAHVLVKALSPAFFAREDTLTPLVATLKGVVARDRAGRCCSATGSAPAASPPRSRSAPGACAFSLIRRGAASFGFSIDAARAAAAAAHRGGALAMGGLLWLGRTAACRRPATGAHGLVQAAALLIAIAAGMAIYGAVAGLFGVTGWREAVSAIRQHAPSGLRR